MILRNHGTLALGETVGEAFIKIYFLERACEAQIKALSAGAQNLNNPPQGSPELDRRAGQGRPQGCAAELSSPGRPCCARPTGSIPELREP